MILKYWFYWYNIDPGAMLILLIWFSGWKYVILGKLKIVGILSLNFGFGVLKFIYIRTWHCISPSFIRSLYKWEPKKLNFLMHPIQNSRLPDQLHTLYLIVKINLPVVAVNTVFPPEGWGDSLDYWSL